MKTFPLWIKASLAAVLVALLAGGIWFYRFQEASVRRQVEGNLAAIGRLKVNQIADWRGMNLAEAKEVMRRRLWIARIARWMENPQVEGGEEILAEFRALQEDHGYVDMILVDTKGHVLLSLSGVTGTGHIEVLPTVAAALREQEPFLSDLHGCSIDPSPHLSVVAPLFVGDGETRKPLGAIVLIRDAEEFLFPLVQSWPVPSRTAETLLVRRDGDDVLFLNSLRFQEDTALKLRIPLSRTDVPAVRAVLGKEGLFQGTDYRGVEVLSVILPVPDSPWFMISKVDASEAYAPWRLESMLILSLLSGAMALVGGAGMFLWQRNRKVHFRQLYLAEAARLAAEARHGITLQSIGDAVIATDARGRVELLNPVAETLTGWTGDEALGRPLEEVFPIVNEETRAEVESPVTRVLRENMVVGLANHTLLIARDGSERPIADSGAPIHDDRGNITGVVLVFRDQTEERRAQQTASEARFFAESIVDTLHQPLIVLDTNMRVVSANRSFYQTFQVTPEETEHGQLWELGNRQWDIPELRHLLEEILPQNTRFDNYEISHDFEHIGPRTMLLNARRIYRPTNHTETVLLAVEDITQRKRAEEALRESERRFMDVLYASDDAILLIGDNMFIDCNEATARMLGYATREEFLQTHPAVLSPPEQPDGRSSFEKAEEMMRLALERGFHRFEWIHRRVNGEDFPVEVSLTPIVHEGKSLLYCVWRDITERKRAELELRESQERFHRALENIPDVLVIYDRDLRIRYINSATLRVTGRPVSDYIGKRDEEVWPPEICEVYLPTLRESLQTRTIRTLETDLSLPDTGVRSLQIACVPLLDEKGEVREVLGLTHDFTERKRAEAEKESLQLQLAQAQKIESVGRLAGGVAHDFNNMLGVILGHVELAMEDMDSSEPLYNDLEQVRKAAQRSADLTRQLLAFARKQTVDPKILDLNDTVTGMLKMLRRLIGEDIDLAWMPGAALESVKIDPAQIDQLLANLCVNARDAIAGVGKITIETENVTFDEAYCAAHEGFLPGRYVLLAVSDDGCGMDKDTREHLFEPFFTTKEVGQGTGLGLATVYGIVKQNQGFINVYSEPGKGTTFKIYLPRHEGQPVQIAAEEAGEIPRGNGETVLLVEDEPAILRLAKTMLHGLGYEVLAAAAPNEALRLAEEHGGAIHLLMTDVVMPGMNGRELAGRLLSLHPNLKALFMSGYTANVIAHRGVLDDGVQFIQKPFSRKELAVKVREVLTRDETIG